TSLLGPVLPLLAAGGLLLTYSRRFVAWSQTYMAALCVALGIVLIERAVPRPTGFASIMLFSSAVYTLFKLRLVPALLVSWGIVALAQIDSVYYLAHPLHPLDRGSIG